MLLFGIKLLWRQKMKLIMIVAGSLFIIFIIFVIIFLRSTPQWEPVISRIEINIPDLNESVYVTKKIWGVSYDHQIILISSQPKKEVKYDPETDYLYEGHSTLFYKVDGRDLKIYTRKRAHPPQHFDSEVNIVQIELDNVGMNKLKENYEKEGLKEIK